MTIAARAQAAGLEPKDYVAKAVQSGELELSCQDPDDPANWPRNMFVWRSNLLGSSGKGHEYFLKHLLGTSNGVLGKDLGAEGREKPQEVAWHDKAPEGKLDLLVTLDFRMSTTCVYSDIVLPTATWYEKNDLNTSRHAPVHPPAVRGGGPGVGSRGRDWEIYKGIAKTFSEIAPRGAGHGDGRRADPDPARHAGELAQPFGVEDWKRGECVPDARPDHAARRGGRAGLSRPLRALHRPSGRCSRRPATAARASAGTPSTRSTSCATLNGTRRAATGQPKLETDIDAIEAILRLAPETNGEVAVKAWEALGKLTGREHAHLALPKEDEKIRFRDIVAQPRKIISSPTWSGIESEKVCYNAGYTNVHELIPWRTLTGRQQLYQDHLWMRAFGEALVTWRRRWTPRRPRRCRASTPTATPRSR